VLDAPATDEAVVPSAVPLRLLARDHPARALAAAEHSADQQMRAFGVLATLATWAGRRPDQAARGFRSGAYVGMTGWGYSAPGSGGGVAGGSTAGASID
jgi:hypothetical protein